MELTDKQLCETYDALEELGPRSLAHIIAYAGATLGRSKGEPGIVFLRVYGSTILFGFTPDAAEFVAKSYETLIGKET